MKWPICRVRPINTKYGALNEACDWIMKLSLVTVFVFVYSRMVGGCLFGCVIFIPSRLSLALSSSGQPALVPPQPGPQGGDHRPGRQTLWSRRARHTLSLQWLSWGNAHINEVIPTLKTCSSDTPARLNDMLNIWTLVNISPYWLVMPRHGFRCYNFTIHSKRPPS